MGDGGFAETASPLGSTECSFIVILDLIAAQPYRTKDQKKPSGKSRTAYERS